MVDAIESRLQDNMWLGGQQPSKEDAEQFVALQNSAPSVDTHPNAFAWFTLVSRFTEAVRGSWTAAATPAAEKVSSRKADIAQLVPPIALRTMACLLLQMCLNREIFRLT